MLEVVGETGVTNEEYTATPEGVTGVDHVGNLNNNSDVRQKRVAHWVTSPEGEPGLKRARLSEVHYGKGHISVMIRFSSAMSIASIIENLLERSLKGEFPTEKLMVQVVWDIDNYDTWEKDDMQNSIEAIDYIANVLRPKVFRIAD